METLILDRDRFVTVDGEKAMVYSKKRLLEQIKQAETRLVEIPELPSDEELLEWARANYPMMDYSRERATLEGVISENSKLLSEID